jgi:hypothetical protein
MNAALKAFAPNGFSGSSVRPIVSYFTSYWLRVSLTPRIRARGAEMADFFGYRLNGPKDVLSQHRHGGL